MHPFRAGRGQRSRWLAGTRQKQHCSDGPVHTMQSRVVPLGLSTFSTTEDMFKPTNIETLLNCFDTT